MLNLELLVYFSTNTEKFIETKLSFHITGTYKIWRALQFCGRMKVGNWSCVKNGRKERPDTVYLIYI